MVVGRPAWRIARPAVGRALPPGSLDRGGRGQKAGRLMTMREPKADVVLEVDGLTINYGLMDGSLDAVRDVSFRLGPGRALGIVGESGCGKSTLARGIFGALPPNGKI